MRLLARAALLGFASGARSTAGIGAQVLATPEFSVRQPEQTLSRLWAKGLFGALVVGEIVADKLPATPSRLNPQGLVPRLVFAAAAAVLAAREVDEESRAAAEPGPEEEGALSGSQPPVTTAPALPEGTWPAVGLAVAASAAASFVGFAFRRGAARVLGHDWPGAVLEDVAALGAAALATGAPGT